MFSLNTIATVLRMSVLALLAAAALSSPSNSLGQAGAPGQITAQSLVDQMLNPDSFTMFHAYANTSGVGDSADPTKRTLYFLSDTDGGNYQRDLVISGRTEHVMVDLTGPGALTRFFIAGPRAHGNIRIYMDGNLANPVFTGDLDQLMEGTAGYTTNGTPLRYTAGPPTVLIGQTSPQNTASEVPPGRNIYMPIPFAKQILVTYDGPARRNYPVEDYIWEYTRFLPGTNVLSWSGQPASSLNTNNQLTQVQVQQENTQAPVLAGGNLPHGTLTDPLGSPTAWSSGVTWSGGQVNIPAQGWIYTNIAGNGGSAIRFLQANLGTNRNDLENLILTLSFNSNNYQDNNAINEAVGDFFGSGEGLHPGTTQMQSVGSNGTMQMLWVMPFQNQATIKLYNQGSTPIKVSILANIGSYAWDSTYSMHFHALRRINGPMYMHSADGDVTIAHTMRMMYIRGKGALVGDSESVVNAQPTGYTHFNWWGEGDELMYVDRSPFPTHRGTGSEDYFGYAYGHTYLFQNPWTSQTGVAPQTVPGQLDYDGTTVLNRVRLADTVPFNDTFRYDFEIHENNDPQVQILVDHTSYFYVIPNSNFQIIPDGVQDGQIYTIESKESGWILTAHGGSATSTDVPAQSADQMFKAHLVSGNTFTLESMNHTYPQTQYLSCCRSDAKTSSYMFLYNLNGSTGSCDQQWTIATESESGTNIPFNGPGYNGYQTLVNGCNNAADVVAGATISGTEVQTYTNNTASTTSGGDSSQVWRFNQVPVSWLNNNQAPILPNGVYEIRNTLNSSSSPNLAIDVPGASTNQSQPLQVYTSNGSNAQFWTINYIANGVYSIVNVNSNMALDNAGQSNGSTAVQYPYSSKTNQQWRIIQQNNGTSFYIQNVANGQYLSMGGSQTAGSPLLQDAVNQVSWQAWYFQPVTY